MTGAAAKSTDIQRGQSALYKESGSECAHQWCIGAILVALILISSSSQADRILPLVLTESIEADPLLSNTQMGLPILVAFAVCRTPLRPVTGRPPISPAAPACSE